MVIGFVPAVAQAFSVNVGPMDPRLARQLAALVDQISTTPVDGDKAKERVEMTVTVQEPKAAP